LKRPFRRNSIEEVTVPDNSPKYGFEAFVLSGETPLKKQPFGGRGTVGESDGGWNEEATVPVSGWNSIIRWSYHQPHEGSGSNRSGKD
jgi:hypothetical protein